MKNQRLEWCKTFWPAVQVDVDLWHRTRCDGFCTMPRTMPQIFAIIDALTKGKPASSTYLALWCRAPDEMLVRIQSPLSLASESGFSGERALTTWQARMQRLAELGFIKIAAGQAGAFEFILIMNPYRVIYQMHQDGKIPDSLYNAFFVRATEVGAQDIAEIVNPPIVFNLSSTVTTVVVGQAS
jgi:hypothetical protein